jgi:hypothetical protein
MDKISDAINFINHKKISNEILLLKGNKDVNKMAVVLREKERNEIEHVLKETDPAEHRATIEVIGEPVIQIKLAEMFDEVMNERLELRIIRQRIKELQDSEKKILTR